MTPLRLIHLADLHLGFPGPHHLVVTEGDDAGRPAREVDVERALAWLSEQIARARPSVDAVLIAGDLFHRTNPLPPAITAAATFVRDTCARGIDVVIVDGNHDAPAAVLHGSPTAYLRLFGAHVVSGTAPRVLAGETWRNPRLRDLAVHAVPYGALRTDPFDTVYPVDGALNVLVAHGRTSGMDDATAAREDWRASLGFPSELLRRGWSYAALGDWHAHGHQPLAGVPAFYAGSLEGLTFGEATKHPPVAGDAYRLRGVLDVTLTPGAPAEVRSLAYPLARSVLRLSPIDADGLDAEDVVGAIDAVTANLSGEALVTLEVRRCAAEVLSAVDRAAVQRIRRRVRFLDLRFEVLSPHLEQSDASPDAERLVDQWDRYLALHVTSDEQRAWLSRAGTARLEEARAARATRAEEA